MALTPNSLRKLRRRLPKGAVPVAAERLRAAGHRYTESYLYMILNGDRYNRVVITALIDLAEEHEAEQRLLNARAAGQTA